MRHLMVLVGLGIVPSSQATTITIVQQKACIDRAFDAAVRGERRQEALQLLEGIAEGRPREIIQTLSVRGGVGADIEEGAPFDSIRTRRYALETIGKTGLPEAVDYLRGLTQGQTGADDSRTIYPAARLALQKALFMREIGAQAQIEFLERKLAEHSGFSVAIWAADELCDRGSVSSIDAVANFFKRLYPGPDGDEMTAFCLERMDIVNRALSRAKAIGTVLRTDAFLKDERILSWAIGQLTAMDTAEADAVLDGYAGEVESKFPDRPEVTSVLQNAMHRGYAQLIRQWQRDVRRK